MAQSPPLQPLFTSLNFWGVSPTPPLGRPRKSRGAGGRGRTPPLANPMFPIRPPLSSGVLPVFFLLVLFWAAQHQKNTRTFQKNTSRTHKYPEGERARKPQAPGNPFRVLLGFSFAFRCDWKRERSSSGLRKRNYSPRLPSSLPLKVLSRGPRWHLYSLMNVHVNATLLPLPRFAKLFPIRHLHEIEAPSGNRVRSRD